MVQHKNSEGYPDPTVGEALCNMEAERRKKEAERLAVISSLMPILRQTAELAGFVIVGRIVLQDKETGKKYR